MRARARWGAGQPPTLGARGNKNKTHRKMGRERLHRNSPHIEKDRPHYELDQGVVVVGLADVEHVVLATSASCERSLPDRRHYLHAVKPHHRVRLPKKEGDRHDFSARYKDRYKKASVFL